MDRPLKDKAVLVAGGSSGIGAATALAAAEAGAQVTIASRRVPDGALAGFAHIPLDVTDEDGVAAALAQAGPFDHVAFTVGHVARQAVRGSRVAQVRDGFDLKFWGAYRIAAHARIVEGGSLTLVSGAYAVRPAKGHVLAACANIAVEGLAKSLALEFAPTRVNCVSPGLVDTPLWSGMDDARKRAMFEQAANALPAGHVGTGADIAAIILLCMTNPMLTGSVLLADGGHVLV
ncbi:SDR family oxidoreductase [Novosphingobium colocasiae]|uniref:SDR family oxidoreductase n=1 Tax=Novosphingobium colocasiae TaxID=1256513 RepID=UPI0035B2A2C3